MRPCRREPRRQLRRLYDGSATTARGNAERPASGFTASRNFSDTGPSTTGDGAGFPNWPRMNIISRGPVVQSPTCRYNR